jgi:hypothetical protein
LRQDNAVTTQIPGLHVHRTSVEQIQNTPDEQDGMTDRDTQDLADGSVGQDRLRVHLAGAQ